jgi:uncharacterized membrane protein (DUF485 family)
MKQGHRTGFDHSVLHSFMEYFMFVILEDVVLAFPQEFLKMATYPDYLTAVVIAGVGNFVFVYD